MALQDYFEYLLTCCLHDPQWTPDEVASIVGWYSNEGLSSRWIAGESEGGSEVEVLVIVRLKDGSWGVLESSEDYTGHGCQCGSRTSRHDTWEDLRLNGIDQATRAQLFPVENQTL
jgi:hypothetical protein